jgi:hypothetical protein
MSAVLKLSTLPVGKRLGMPVSEFAKACGVSPMTVYRYIERGLPVFRLGKLLVDVELALPWLRAHTASEAAE